MLVVALPCAICERNERTNHEQKTNEYLQMNGFHDYTVLNCTLGAGMGPSCNELS